MTTTPPPAERLHALDALRGGALILGVMLHAGLSYLPGGQSWPVMDSDRSASLSALLFGVHMFRMMTFFLLAGFFGRLACERRGARRFAWDRARRIGTPLVVVLLPMAFMLPRPTPSHFPLLHLWFLYLLLPMYGAALAARAWAPRVLARMVDHVLPLLVRPAGAITLAAPLAATLLAMPGWRPWWGIPTPDEGLVPNAAAVVGYGMAFAFGWAVHRRRAMLETWRRRWPGHLALALAATAACIAIVGVTPSFGHDAAGPARPVYACLYAAGAWLWPAALTGLALRFLDRPSATRRYLADASYWVYLVHLPLVIALQVAFARLDWPWQVEYPLLLAIAFAIMLAAYHWGVRATWLGMLLNGRRIVRIKKDAPKSVESAERYNET